MADKEYVSLSVTPLAREHLRQQTLTLSATVGRQLTMSETIQMMAGVTTYARTSGERSFDEIMHVDSLMRAQNSGGCE
jgi:hypothetical protein